MNYKDFRYVLLILISALTSQMANATTCVKDFRCETAHDGIPPRCAWVFTNWVDNICRYDPVPGNRCGADPISGGNLAAQCSPSTPDCPSCVGTIAPANWVVTGLADGTTKRCICGCFAEETRFKTSLGGILASELMARSAQQQNMSVAVLANAAGDLREMPVSQVVWGEEKQDAYEIMTNGGRSIVLSSAHPVVLANQQGTITKIKTANQVVVGDILSDENDHPDTVTSVKPIRYQRKMVNYFVQGEDFANHVVIANGLKMGDNGLQQLLASRDRRILERNDILELLKNEAKNTGR